MRLSILLSLFASITYADLIVLSTGDSVSTAVGTRLGFEIDLLPSITPDFVGDTEQTWLGNDYSYQGYGGFRFEHMLTGTSNQDGLTDALTRYSPEVITILGGYNDVAGEASMASIEADLDALVDYGFAHSSAIILVANVTTFRYGWAHKQPRVIEWNSTLLSNINARRAAGQQIGYIDNFSEIGPESTAADGLHLNGRGAITAGRNWFPVWQPMSIPEPSAFTLLAVLGAALSITRKVKQ